MDAHARIRALADALGHTDAEVVVVALPNGGFEAQLVKRVYVARQNYGLTQERALGALANSLRFLALHVERNARADVEQAERSVTAYGFRAAELARVLTEDAAATEGGTP